MSGTTQTFCVEVSLKYVQALIPVTVNSGVLKFLQANAGTER